MFRSGPVAEHHRHRGQHLHLYAVSIAFLEAGRAIPAVGLDLPEEGAVVLHHARATGTMMVQVDEAAVAVTLLKAGPGLRQYMCMDVYLEHAIISSSEVLP